MAKFSFESGDLEWNETQNSKDFSMTLDVPKKVLSNLKKIRKDLKDLKLPYNIMVCNAYSLCDILQITVHFFFSQLG